MAWAVFLLADGRARGFELRLSKMTASLGKRRELCYLTCLCCRFDELIWEEGMAELLQAARAWEMHGWSVSRWGLELLRTAGFEESKWG